MIEVTWFRNDHEHRNDWIRYGMMQLHDLGRITYTQVPLTSAKSGELAQEIVSHEHRHTSVLAIGTRSSRRVVILDSEDSFFWMSPLAAFCDIYFCSGYNCDLYEHRRWENPYRWLKPYQVSFYEQRARELIERYGAHFRKVRPLAPIMPTAHLDNNVTWPEQKYRNLEFRLRRLATPGTLWRLERRIFDKRAAVLAQLRETPLSYDVTLADSLWGWPTHRIRLHEELRRLSGRWRINSVLNWTPPLECDGSTEEAHQPSDFPMKVGHIEDYEKMLAASRLGIFATGFHWGWRSIMALALYLGIPVLCDRLILEPHFDLRAFDIIENNDIKWGGVEKLLADIDDTSWYARRKRNQAQFDQFMSPIALASYIIEIHGRATTTDTKHVVGP